MYKDWGGGGVAIPEKFGGEGGHDTARIEKHRAVRLVWDFRIFFVLPCFCLIRRHFESYRSVCVAQHS
jgi:hypothetical protein